MDRYLVISPHSHEECKHVIDQVESAGYLTHMNWGCKDNDHTGYAEIEAESHEQALMLVPALVRRKAKAIRVVKYDPQTGFQDEVVSPTDKG
jgi:hypothetical protein